MISYKLCIEGHNNAHFTVHTDQPRRVHLTGRGHPRRGLTNSLYQDAPVVKGFSLKVESYANYTVESKMHEEGFSSVGN